MSDFEINFLSDAQRTQSLHIDIPRKELITGFHQFFVSFGSCFAQNIERVLKPYGVQFWFNRDICAHYSVATIQATLEQVASGRTHTPEEIYAFEDERGGIVPMKYFYKRRIHGEAAVERTLERLAKLDEECRTELRRCDHIFITLGTSRIVRKTDNKMAVSCATGMPKDQWTLEMLTIEETLAGLESILESIRTIRGGSLPNVFFTISPQRYWFDKGLLGDTSPVVDNCLSKSILRVALDLLIKNHPGESVHYFPSFELVIDELRVYESLSHYDFLHIEQEFTPKYVVKRFLTAHASDDVLRQLTLVDKGARLSQALKTEIDENLPQNDSFYTRQVDEFISQSRDIVGQNTWSPALLQHINDMLVMQGRSDMHGDLIALHITRYEHIMHKKVAVWGASGNFQYVWAPVFKRLGDKAELALLVDGDAGKWGSSVEGQKVQDPKVLENAEVDCVIVASNWRDAIVTQLRAIRPDLPVILS
jgi:hypothetical protein